MAGFGALGADRSGSAGFVVGGAAIPASGSVLGAITTLVIPQSSPGAALAVSWQRANCFGRGGWGCSGEL
jgi:hypothetical protein